VTGLDRIPEVVQVYPQSDFSVVVYFDDGRLKKFDARPLLEKGGVFLPLRDEALFRTKCTVMNGTLAWDLSGVRDETTCIDIDPIEIWSGSSDVEEPEPLRSLGQRLNLARTTRR
jgi:hypothetical protein